MIVVFGSTGTIGGQVLRHLREQGADVRAAVRSEAKAGPLRAQGVSTVLADLAEPGTLPAALEGADRVFLASPGAPQQVTLESALVDAVARTGAHLVKLAALGYDAGPADQAIALAANHARVVEHATTSSVPLTVVAPSGFTSNLLASAATIQQGALYASAGDGSIAWVDPSDVGAVAAHVLTSDGHEGASYDVTGPEAIDHDELASRISTALGREVRYVDVPPEQFAGSLRSAGLPGWLADALNELNQVYRRHEAEVVTDEVRKATGRPARGVDDWLPDNAAALSG